MRFLAAKVVDFCAGWTILAGKAGVWPVIARVCARHFDLL